MNKQELTRRIEVMRLRIQELLLRIHLQETMGLPGQINSLKQQLSEETGLPGQINSLKQQLSEEMGLPKQIKSLEQQLNSMRKYLFLPVWLVAGVSIVASIIVLTGTWSLANGVRVNSVDAGAAIAAIVTGGIVTIAIDLVAVMYFLYLIRAMED